MLQVYASVVSIIASTLVLQLGNGIIGPTVVLRTSMAGEAFGNVGLIPAAYGLGFIVGCFWGRRLIHNIGHIRSFAVAAALLALAAIAMQLVPDTTALIVLRGVMGCGIAVVSTCADSWVSNGTPQAFRGRVLALYAVTIKCAHFFAPAMLAAIELIAREAILIAAMLFAASLVPVALTRMPTPEINETQRLSPLVLLRGAPSAFAASAAIGLANGAVLSLLPAHGISVGLPAASVLFLLTAAHVGGLALQWPVGLLSDLCDRRWVMAGSMAAAAALAFALPANLKGESFVTLLLVFLWGGFALSVYSVALAHAVDHVTPAQTVTACATLLVIWSSGATIGPAVAGLIMQQGTADGLFYFGGACNALAAGFILFRVLSTVRRRRKTSFVNVPVSGAEVHRLDPRSRPADL